MARHASQVSVVSRSEVPTEMWEAVKEGIVGGEVGLVGGGAGLYVPHPRPHVTLSSGWLQMACH